MSTIVNVEGLRKTYGTTVAVDEVSFEVREGEVFGIARTGPARPSVWLLIYRETQTPVKSEVYQ